MRKLHVAQDDYGFWQLSLERDDGTLVLMAHQFVSPTHLIQDAHEMVKKGEYPDAVVVVDPQRRPGPGPVENWPDNYQRPRPKKAGA